MHASEGCYSTEATHNYNNKQEFKDVKIISNIWTLLSVKLTGTCTIHSIGPRPISPAFQHATLKAGSGPGDKANNTSRIAIYI